MAKRASKSDMPTTERWYRGADVPMRVIRRFAREVAERFHPEQIILFGSYAYGQPQEDSDVDILVVMPARNEMDQALRISFEIDPPFPLDIVVRTPKGDAMAIRGGRFVLARDRVAGQCPLWED